MLNVSKGISGYSHYWIESERGSNERRTRSSDENGAVLDIADENERTQRECFGINLARNCSARHHCDGESEVGSKRAGIEE